MPTRDSTRCRVEDLLDESGELVSDNQAKTELFTSRFFTSVFTEEGPEVPHSCTAHSRVQRSSTSMSRPRK